MRLSPGDPREGGQVINGAAMPVATPPARPTVPPAGRQDPRLRAWRDLFAASAAALLREHQAAWSEPGLDDAGRAAAAVGLADRRPGGAPPELPVDGLLARVVALTRIDLASEAVLAIAWWATVDAQVAVLLGCVHDDAGRRYPTLGAVAAVLGPVGLDIPLAIDDGHGLVAQGLCEPVPAADAPVRLPPWTAALLAGQRPAPPSPVVVPAARVAAVAERAATLVALGATVLVRCELADDRRVVCDAVAGRLGIPLAFATRPAPVAALLFRLGHGLPAAVLAGTDAPPEGCLLAVAGPDAVGGAGRHVLDLEPPSIEEAQGCWEDALRKAGVRVGSGDPGELAGRLSLSESAIDGVVAHAVLSARAAGVPPTTADVRAALRDHPRHELGGLARRVPPSVRTVDLVLPDVTRSGLTDVVAHARHSAEVHAQMGLTGPRGLAVIVLFHGPPGTGKTAAAEAVAAELDRDLWVVDLARVVSKWLGETQRNLDAVLHEAAAAGAILLFDEADGLFGKRGEVTDARDRYANLEIDHLLQRIELHGGVVILTSNRPNALDEAFARRIRLAVRFDLPDHPERQRIWRGLLPAELLAPGVSTDAAAGEELAGAAIRAAAVAAAVAAAEAGGQIEAEHLRYAVARELEKLKRAPVATRPR